MTDDNSEHHDQRSPATREWVARRDRVLAAAKQDRARARAEHDEKEQDVHRAYENPAAFAAGLVVIVLLLIACWFVISEMRCDPYYSDEALTHRSACR